MRGWRILVLAWGWLAMAAGGSAAEFVYVSLAGENRIAGYRQQEDGTLAPASDTKVGGAPGSLAADLPRRRLFASLRSTQQLASFRIDAATGRLEPISVVPAGSNVTYAAVDDQGRWLLAASYSSGLVSVHAIGPDGTLADKPLQTLPTDKNAHAMVLDRSQRFAFTPHTGPNAIYQFRFDPATGRLAANDPPRQAGPAGTGPRHLKFHPTLPVAYTSDELRSSITVYRFDAERGTLTPMQTASTLPEIYQGPNTTAEVKVHPSGRFVYVSNRGHDSLAEFAIDQASGQVRPLGQAATEKTPRSFDLDAAGRFAYAAGEGGTRLRCYRLDADTGRLASLAVLEVGQQPAWVQAVRLDP